MLVLTRRPNESIIIANNIRITVVSVGPGRVKLGIEAPPNVRVDRKEIHDKIEHSADVLATVGEATDHDQNTLVGHNAGADTAVIVSAAEVATEPAPMPVATSGISRFRAPRKPR